jgi:hypothetical protein
MKKENCTNELDWYIINVQTGLNKYGEYPYKDIDQKKLKQRLAAIKRVGI